MYGSGALAAGCTTVMVACQGGGVTTGATQERPGAEYRVTMDAPSPEDRVAAFTQYFPASLRAHAGDSITYAHERTAAVHTVTFGVAPDRSNQPLFDPSPDGFSPTNEVVVGRCFTDQEPDPSWTECPNKELYSSADLLPYAGVGYWNSGFVEAETEVVVPIDPAIEPGTYSFVCLIHPAMSGELEIVPASAEADTPADVGEQADAEQAQVLAEGVPKVPAPPPTPGGATVAAGTVLGTVQVDEFTPAEVQIEAGDTVTWEFAYVHTVTFTETELDPSRIEFPTGAPSGSALGDEGAHSGLIFETSTDPTFSLRFDKPGDYEYNCILHTRMQGIVHVLKPARD